MPNRHFDVPTGGLLDTAIPADFCYTETEEVDLYRWTIRGIGNMSWIDWIGDTFIVLMSIGLLIYLATDYRFFRGDLFVLLRSSVHSAVSSVTARLRLALAALAMVGLASWTWFGVFPTNVLIFMSLILAMTVYGSIRPAAAVVLAASRSPHAREIGTEARRVCGLLRVIYFLDPSQFQGPKPSSFPLPWESDDRNDNLFQTDSSSWRSIVLPLLELIPIIIVDKFDQSEGLHEELAFIASEPGLLRKTIVCGDADTKEELRPLGFAQVPLDWDEFKSAVALAVEAQKRRARLPLAQRRASSADISSLRASMAALLSHQREALRPRQGIAVPIVKIAAKIAVGSYLAFFAVAAFTADVIAVNPGQSVDVVARTLAAQGRNVAVLPNGGNIDMYRRQLRAAGVFSTVFSVLLLGWTLSNISALKHEFNARRRAKADRIAVPDASSRKASGRVVRLIDNLDFIKSADTGSLANPFPGDDRDQKLRWRIHHVVRDAKIDMGEIIQVIDRTEFIKDVNARAFVIRLVLKASVWEYEQHMRFREAWNHLIRSDEPQLQLVLLVLLEGWSESIRRPEILRALKRLLRSRDESVREHTRDVLYLLRFTRLFGLFWLDADLDREARNAERRFEDEKSYRRFGPGHLRQGDGQRSME